MKKIILVVLTLALFTSCGPHRMKCGPGKRCVEVPVKKIQLGAINTLQVNS